MFPEVLQTPIPCTKRAASILSAELLGYEDVSPVISLQNDWKLARGYKTSLHTSKSRVKKQPAGPLLLF